jgi:cytochrome b6-f complex iron-sulfur subunit
MVDRADRTGDLSASVSFTHRVTDAAAQLPAAVRLLKSAAHRPPGTRFAFRVNTMRTIHQSTETDIRSLPAADECDCRERRQFCSAVTKALSLAAVGAAFAGCGGSPSGPSSSTPPLATINATVTGTTIRLTIDASSPLSAVGSAALVQASAGPYLVVRISQESFNAMTAVCTHEGCTVNGYENQTFVCPCHGSRYNTNGGVVQGPAPRALRQFSNRLDGDVLTITIA